VSALFATLVRCRLCATFPNLSKSSETGTAFLTTLSCRPKITALVLGCAERTIRYHPKLKRIEISRGRYGFRVGNVREITRGEAA